MRLTTPILVGAIAFLGYIGLRHEAEHEGELNQKIKAREAVIAALAKERVPAIDSTYVIDTLTFRSVQYRYITLRDTLRLTDTVQVKQFVRAADSTVHACRQAVETCEHRVAVRDSVIHEQTLLVADLKRRGRGFRLLGIPLGGAIGATATPSGFGPGVTFGVRF